MKNSLKELRQNLPVLQHFYVALTYTTMATDLRPAAPFPRMHPCLGVGVGEQHMQHPASTSASGASAKHQDGDPAAAGREGMCCAIMRTGQPCGYKSKGEHPELGPLCGIHHRCAAAPKPECSICLAECTKPRQCKALECGHVFHKRCIKRWFGRGSLTCPMCRAVCLNELGSAHALLSARVRHLLRVLPRPPNVCFAAYMLGLLNSEPVVQALGVSVEEQQLLVELAFQSFTQVHFFEYMRLLNL